MSEEIDLWDLVIEVDSELIQKGVEPYKRPEFTYLIISKRLRPGMSAVSKHDPIFHAVNEIYDQLYRPEDLYMPPLHIGAFMFRDVFFPVRIPVIWGSPAINPVDFLTHDFYPGVPDIPKRWLFDDKQTGLSFFDQVIDLMDFVYGLDDLEKLERLPDKPIELWNLAKGQLEAAAATLLGSFDKYAAIQNCCIATEQLLKGALVAKDKDMDEETLKKKYGHSLKKLTGRAIELLPDIDSERVLSIINQSPDYVKSRYEALQYSRLELGRLLMNTQFISGEILRQFSDRDFRSDFCTIPDPDWNLTDRVYPQK